MKKRIGTLGGKPIVVGDENLVTLDEIHQDNIHIINEKTSILETADEDNTVVVELRDNGGYLDYEYVRDLPFTVKNNTINIELDSFGYSSSVGTVYYIMVAHKKFANYIRERGLHAAGGSNDGYWTKTVTSKSDEDHHISIFNPINASWDLYKISGYLDEDEGSTARLKIEALDYIKTLGASFFYKNISITCKA